MDTKIMPVVSFKVEHLRDSVLQHMGLIGCELGDAVDEAMKKAVADYDFEGEVKRIVFSVIDNEINDFFSYGVGRDAIKDKVGESIRLALGLDDNE